MDTAVKRCSYVPEVQICTVGQETKGGPMKSESIAALAKALSAAQADYNALIKDSNNPFFKSKYADLAACLDSVKDALKAHGLAVIQTTDITEAGNVRLVTTLAHESGEWITGEYPVKPIKEDPQGYGAAMTYARRYCLQAILGLAAEDDDGEEASGRPEKKQTPAKQEPVAPAKQDQPDVMTISGVIEDVLVAESKPDSKKKWKKIAAKINNGYYSTFDKEIGQAISDCKGMSVDMRYTYDGKYNTVVDFSIKQEKNNEPPLPF